MQMENNSTVIVLGVTAVVVVLSFLFFKSMGSKTDSSSTRYQKLGKFYICNSFYNV
jgi:hypothetical protein